MKKTKSGKASKVLDIVDGHNFMNRAFYANAESQKLHTSKGVPTGALKTFLAMINHLMERRLRTNDSINLVVVFDHKKGSDYRKLLMQTFLSYAVGENANKLAEKFLTGYKGNRENDEKSSILRPQIDMAIEILKARGIQTIRSPLGEADDVIGSLCFQLKCRKLIHSRDGDFAQLLKPDTRLRLPKQANCEELTVTYQDCLMKYGVLPSTFVDFLALCGDASDNIPGIPGLGEKTAIKLIQEYDTLEEILSAQHKGALGKKLSDPFYQSLALMCRELVTIKTDLKVDKKISSYLVPDLKEVEKKVRKLEKSFEFKPTLTI
jgi:DNA polymerase-1